MAPRVFFDRLVSSYLATLIVVVLLAAGSYALLEHALLHSAAAKGYRLVELLALVVLVLVLALFRRAAFRASEQRYRDLLVAAERQGRELELLEQVRSALAREMDQTRIFRVAVEAIPSALGYPLVSLYLREGDYLVLQHQVGYPSALERLPLDAGICGRVLGSGEPVLLADVASDPAFIAASDGITSEICVPLFDDHGYTIGVLNVESTAGLVLTEDDLRVMAALCEQVSIAIDRAQLYAEAQRERDFSAAIIDTADSLIVVLDTQGRIVRFNGGCERTTGYRFSEVQGRPFWEFLLPPEEVESVRAVFNQLVVGAYLPNYENSWLRRDGRRRQIVWANTVLRDAPGQPAYIIGTGIDITERKQAEAALRESELLYRSLVSALSEGIVLQRADGSIQACNASAEQILGLTADQMMGRTSLDRRWRAVRADGTPFPGEEHPSMVALLSGQALKDVIMGVHKPNDTTPTWISINAQPLLREGEQQPYAVVSSFFDITERRRAEQELRFQKTLLEAQSEAAIDGILVVSPERRWLYANRHFAELWNFEAEVMVAASSAVGLPQMLRQLAEPEPVRAAIERLYQQPEAHGQGELVLLDGKTLEWYSAPVRDQDGTYYGRVWYYRDVSERKAVERMKNEFVSVVSHELRTPLTSIRGALGLIAGGVGGALPQQVRGMVDIALKNSERLVRLINDILDIEKIESGKMTFDVKPLMLAPLITQALEANRAYGEQLGVSFALAHPLPELWVSGDADRLTQVLTNLLSNAAKFSPPGEAVLLSLGRAGRGQVRLSVTDHGPGIPEAFRSRIFQKFAQADASSTRQQGGTGLGLSITKAILERHGGQIGFTSEPGKGTTFWFDLPEWQALPPALPAQDAAASPHILVCDDDPDIAMLLTMLLQQAGFRADTASNAAQARELLARGSYAGMTLDIALPGEDGITLIRTLRDDPHTHDLPVVVVSASADQERPSLSGDALGVVDWLQKPIQQEQLLAAVRAAVQRVASPNPPRVLHVEDDADIVAFISLLLAPAATVVAASEVGAARTLLQQERFDLVILDLGLPDGSGVDLLPVLRQWQPPIPALIFSARELGPGLPQHVAAALVKSRTSNDDLRVTITGLLSRVGAG
jgi:PAS domain S-box-containing protein